MKWTARLPLRPWTGPRPSASYFDHEAPVLWLSGSPSSGWLESLRGELSAAGRLWTPEMSTHRVPTAGSRGNPWSHRPDDYAPLRWGLPEEDIRELAGVADRPSSLAGVVVDGLLDGLGSQETRTLLGQVAGVLGADRPWLLCERNGASVREVVRNLRRSDAERGEGRETVRTSQELRRFLEVAGLGVSGAWGVSSERGRSLRRLVPGGGGWPLLVLEGRRVGGNAE